MNMRPFLSLVMPLAICWLLHACSTGETANKLSPTVTALHGRNITVDTLEFYDTIRSRRIPYALFKPEKVTGQNIKLVIFSHGYGANYPLNYLNYSYLTKKMAQKGYWVLSVQHELPGDSVIPRSGNMQVVRMPFWKRGEENILVVLDDFKRLHPNIDIASIDLIGHSNGGDMSVLTAKNHPDLFRKVITLDHLRMPIPLLVTPAFSTLRSSDKHADEGVLPDRIQQKELGITVIPLKNITHDEMNDGAPGKKKKKIAKTVVQLLEEKSRS